MSAGDRDRDRILMTIAALAPTSDLRAKAGYGPRWASCGSEGWQTMPQPGDIVRASTSAMRGPAPHRFSVARLVRWVASDTALVREIGGVDTCTISNEMFSVLVGLPAWKLSEGHAWRVVEQVRRAFRLFDTIKGHRRGWDRFDCLFSDLRISEDGRTAHIVVRPHAFVRKHDVQEEQTYTVDVPVRPRIPSQQAIAERVWAACPWHRAPEIK